MNNLNNPKSFKVSGGKKLQSVKEKLNFGKTYSLVEALTFLKDNTFTKFDETVDIALRLGVDATKADQNVRGIVSLPYGTGKVIKVAAFVEGKNIELAKQAGADMVGLDDLIEELKKGCVNYDVYVSTPDVMSKVSTVAKILGPKGLMPNPKLGTVGSDIAQVVTQIKSGQIKFCSDKAGIVHAGVGKLSFTLEALEKNIRAFIDSVIKVKPSSAKVPYLIKGFIGSTMGPSLKIELSSGEV